MASRSAIVDIEEGAYGSRRRRTCRWFLSQNVPLIVQIVSFGLGIGLGYVLRQRAEPYSFREQFYLRLPGNILLYVLSCLSLPIVASNVITCLTSLDFQVPKLGFKATLYYLVTDVLALVIGVVCVFYVRPGDRGLRAKNPKAFFIPETADFLIDTVRSLFPSNLIETTFQRTALKEIRNPKYTGYLSMEPKYILTMVAKKEMNMVGVVMLSIFTALAINVMGRKGQLLKSFFNSVTELSLTLLSAAVWYSPLGVMFLLMYQITVADIPTRVLEQMAYYSVTVIGGLVFHSCVVLPILFIVLGQRNPLHFINMIHPALLTALRVASSRQTLPITISNLIENNKVEAKVVKIVSPLGTTINMNGTVLFGAVAAIFITQTQDIDLDFAELLVISWMTLAISTAVAAVPHAGLVAIIFALGSVEVSFDKIVLVVVTDWFVDRFRTFVNVLNNCFGCGIVEHLSLRDENRQEHLDALREIVPDLQNYGILAKVQSHRIPMAYVRPKSELMDNSSQSFGRLHREPITHRVSRSKSHATEVDAALVSEKKTSIKEPPNRSGTHEPEEKGYESGNA